MREAGTSSRRPQVRQDACFMSGFTRACRRWLGGSCAAAALPVQMVTRPACGWLSAANTKQKHAGAPHSSCGDLQAGPGEIMSAPGLRPSVRSSVCSHVWAEQGGRGEDGQRWMTAKSELTRKREREVSLFPSLAELKSCTFLVISSKNVSPPQKPICACQWLMPS